MNIFKLFMFQLALVATVVGSEAEGEDAWKAGIPIVTYYAGPPMTDAVARQMAEGGFNLVCCNNEAELDVARRHGLRAQLTDRLELTNKRSGITSKTRKVRTASTIRKDCSEPDAASGGYKSLPL